MNPIAPYSKEQDYKWSYDHWEIQRDVPKKKQKHIIRYIKIKIYLIPSTTNSTGTFVPTWSFFTYKPIALFAASTFTWHTHIKVVKCIFPLKETREWWLSMCAITRIIQLIETTWVNKVKLRTKIAIVNGIVTFGHGTSSG